MAPSAFEQRAWKKAAAASLTSNSRARRASSCVSRRVLERDARALGERAQRLAELQPSFFMMKLKMSPPVPQAPKQCQRLARGLDVERRRALAVERAQRDVVAARPLQRRVLRDEVDDVDALLDLVERRSSPPILRNAAPKG